MNNRVVYRITGKGNTKQMNPVEVNFFIRCPQFTIGIRNDQQLVIRSNFFFHIFYLIFERQIEEDLHGKYNVTACSTKLLAEEGHEISIANIGRQVPLDMQKRIVIR